MYHYAVNMTMSRSKVALHLLNGGYHNGDQKWLERSASGTRRVKSWIVPKSASIGDEVVINVANFGLFATATIASPTKPRSDWKRRYCADLEGIRLIEPAISLAAVRRHIPELKWARYPRSIATPTVELAEQIRDYIKNRRNWKPDTSDLSEAALELANIEELWKIALIQPRDSKPKLRAKLEY